MVVTATLLPACAGQFVSPITSVNNGGEPSEELLVGEVIHIADGDTFDLGTGGGETTIRMLGVNAPERDECLYDEATDTLALSLAPGDVGVEDHGLDQYGRTLGYVWAGETFVNLTLVEHGLAIATTPGDPDTRGQSLIAADEEAYQSGLGLWDRTACGGSPEAAVGLVIDASGHNPPGADDEVLGLEYVTIMNTGDAMADISGWILRDESSVHRFRFPDGSVIRPGDEIRVPSDDPGWDPGGAPVWNNNGDIALLLMPGGAFAIRQRFGP